jgi:hypothetical protein
MTNPLYQPFLANEKDPREYLREPFRVDDYTVYTNGHTLIAVLNGELAAECPKLTEKVRGYISDINQKISSQNLLKIKPFKYKLFECKKCNSTGKIDKCPECSGFGEVSFENDHNEYWFDCKTCGGVSGKFDCNMHHEIIGVNFLGFPVNPKYLEQANRLPDARFTSANENNLDFVFDGGVGRIMCMMSKNHAEIDSLQKIEFED